MTFLNENIPITNPIFQHNNLSKLFNLLIKWDLEVIAEELAGRHHLSKEGYSVKSVSEVCPVGKGETRDFEFYEPTQGIIERDVLILKTRQFTLAAPYASNFVKFLREINEELKKENVELTYSQDICEEGASAQEEAAYLNLIDLTQRYTKKLKPGHRETDVTLYGRGILAACFDSVWFASEREDPQLKGVFWVIEKAYNDIGNSI